MKKPSEIKDDYNKPDKRNITNDQIDEKIIKLKPEELAKMLFGRKKP